MARKKKTEIDAEIRQPRTLVLFAEILKGFRAPDDLNVSQWAEKNRVLPASSAEPGPWRTSRTPYLEEPMKAFTDPKVTHIVMVSASQTGKSEFELNCLGYIIDQDPGTILYVQPTVEEAKKFSRLRISPMIKECRSLRKKVSREKGRDASNTVLNKSFPGGSLIIIGSNAPQALASTPAPYIIGDEMDRWAKSAGKEGDPWELAVTRQTTFPKHKALEVSTPTVKGDSRIAESFQKGTQERWCHQCPDCGEFINIQWGHMKYDYDTIPNGAKKTYEAKEILWECPVCGTVHEESEMRRQPQKWIAENPGAISKGVRSFWMNAFCSPWTRWLSILQRFLDAKGDIAKTQVIYNTLFGLEWENRGDMPDNDGLQARREHYEADLPEGVLLLTCGVDTQDDRLEYEVLGYGRGWETWGIQKGVILGRPDWEDSDHVWAHLDEILDRVWKFEDGRGLRIALTFIDSGGHYTKEVYYHCGLRFHKRVFPIKGRGGEGVPFTQQPKKQKIEVNRKKVGEVWLYSIGVDAGKSRIMQNLKVQTPGPKYCHFPVNEGRGYDARYFDGLLSEHLVLESSKSSTKWVWQKLPGHQRNEPLDIRNYNLAAAETLIPDWDKLERELMEQEPGSGGPDLTRPAPKRRRVIKNRAIEDY